MLSMNLERDICYRALKTRDRRFDGRFFTGVTSTGVYCRPVCPARTPKRDNCRFFPHAAAAAAAGFRPCRRCRPEAAPGTPAWQGASATVSRALRLIEGGALDNGGVNDLAASLGVGARHLRRLFDDHLGASPLAVAMTRRIHFAKRLLEETDLPVLQVALSSGFHNARRFNDAFRKSFDCTPGSVRRLPAGGERPTGIRLRLSYRSPLAWDAMIRYLGPRAIPGVEQVQGQAYRRTFQLDGVEGILSVSQDRSRDCMVLQLPAGVAPVIFPIAERVRRFLDLSADPAEIEDQLASDPDLAFSNVPRGLRVPGAWDRFELAVRAILGQQVTVKGATRLSGRLAERFGTKLKTGAGSDLHLLFPSPERLAAMSGTKIASIGIPAKRGETIRALARAVAAGEPVLEPASGVEQAVVRLTALPGIGDWTARYIAMRALREPDAFPAGDLGLRKALSADGGPLTAAALQRRSESWKPWRAYAAMRLWTSLSNGKDRS